MNENKTNPTTPQETTKTTTKPATTTEPKRIDRGASMQHGIPISEIKLKSVLELRREFGENWM